MLKTHTEKNVKGSGVRGYLQAAVLCLLGLGFVYLFDHLRLAVIFGAGTSEHRVPGSVYIPVHSVLEFGSIVVSFAVFTIGWYGYRQTRNRQDLFIAVTYMVVGAIDFVHTLSYKGMPDFLATNSVGLAAAYWVAARLIDGAALLLAPFLSRGTKSRALEPRFLVTGAIVLAVGLTALFTIYSNTVSSLMYNSSGPSGHLTGLKIWLEYTVILLYVGAFWTFGRTRSWPQQAVVLVRTALVLAIGSEVCFTLYRTAYDGYNLLGHLLKVISYYYVLQALFVSALRRPYMELSDTKEQLERAFDRIGDALASGLEKDRTLKLISSLAREMLGGDFSAIGEVRHGETMHVANFDGKYPEPFDVPLRESISGLAVLHGRPVSVPDLRTEPLARQELLNLGLRSLLTSPIEGESRKIGAIYVASYIPDAFTEKDAEMLTAFSRQASRALQDAEAYEKERKIADALQSVILPPPKLKRNGYSVTGRYNPAWDEARVGGDFYDYFDLDDHRLAFVIGDVSGKGLQAAVHTAIVKYSYQAYVREGHGPADALARIDRAFKERTHESLTDGVFVTLFCGVLDASTGKVVYANAGHEPGIKTSAQGEARLCESTGPILGLSIPMGTDEVELHLEPGDSLLLYTDGITEARVQGDLFGLDRLVDSVTRSAAASPEDLLNAVYEDAKSHSEDRTFKDDVAMILVRRD